MIKDVVICNECESFYINSDGTAMCNNKRGIPFPSATDFCSYGVATDKARTVNNDQLLKLVYEQRKR